MGNNLVPHKDTRHFILIKTTENRQAQDYIFHLTDKESKAVYELLIAAITTSCNNFHELSGSAQTYHLAVQKVKSLN